MGEREELIKNANTAMARFVSEHPQYSVDDHQPEYRGGTNYATFGRYHDASSNRIRPVVFKYFVRTYRWSQERFNLRHFAPTGYVPHILAEVPDEMIVMDRLMGDGLGGVNLSKEQKKQISHEIGQGVAALVQTPFPDEQDRPIPESDFERFGWRMDVGAILREHLTLSRKVQQSVPAYQVPLFTESLDFSERQVDYIDQQARIIFHEDIGNMSVHEDHFQGFYDLEMARVGTEAQQLGVAIHLCYPHDDPQFDWHAFLDGYQRASGRELTTQDFCAILAMNHFYCHTRLCRWGKWDGDPTQAEHVDFAERMETDYLSNLRNACHVLQEWVDLERWFPSLV